MNVRVVPITGTSAAVAPKAVREQGADRRNLLHPKAKVILWRRRAPTPRLAVRDTIQTLTSTIRRRRMILSEIVYMVGANMAAHGALVEPNVPLDILQEQNQILGTLDERIEKLQKK